MFKLKRIPSHPGQILKEEFLDELNISQTELASALGTTFRTINEIINEKRNISTEIAIKLSKFFRTSIELWLNLQNQYDIYRIYNKKKEMIDKVRPMKRRKQKVWWFWFKNKKPRDIKPRGFLFGSGDRTWTCNLRVMSPTSYQLLHPAM